MLKVKVRIYLFKQCFVPTSCLLFAFHRLSKRFLFLFPVFPGRLPLSSSGSGLTSPLTLLSTTPTGAGTPPWLWSKDDSRFSLPLWNLSNIFSIDCRICGQAVASMILTFIMFGASKIRDAEIGVFTVSSERPTLVLRLERWSRRWDWSLLRRYFQWLMWTQKKLECVSLQTFCISATSNPFPFFAASASDRQPLCPLRRCCCC